MKDPRDATPDEIKNLIKCIHEIWYNEFWMQDPSLALRLHRHMSFLFDYAEITSSLVENNPGEVTPCEFKMRTGAKE